MARIGHALAPSARLTTTAVHIDERGILVHDTWQGYLQPADLRVIDAPELQRLPEPEVREFPPTVLVEPVDLPQVVHGDAEAEIRAVHREELQWHARWAFRAVLAITVFVAVAIRAGWMP